MTTPASVVKSLFGNHARASALAQFNTYKGLDSYKFRNIPEFLFAGRANVGKSSLINAVLGTKKLVRSSSKPGATKTLNFFAPGSIGTTDPRLYIVDGPGYGQRGRSEWGHLFMEYASQRQSLRRIFVLISITHGLKPSDTRMLEELNSLVLDAHADHTRTTPLSFQIVLTKVDEWPLNRSRTQLLEAIKSIKQDVWKVAPTCMPEAILTSAKAGLDPQPGQAPTMVGVDQLRLCIAEAGGFL